MNISALEKRITKLEKTTTAAVTQFLMPDGSKLSLTDSQRRKGFLDSVYGVESFEGNVFLTAIGVNDGSTLLPLVRGIVNPVATEPSSEPMPTSQECDE